MFCFFQIAPVCSLSREINLPTVIDGILTALTKLLETMESILVKIYTLETKRKGAIKSLKLISSLQIDVVEIQI